MRRAHEALHLARGAQTDEAMKLSDARRTCFSCAAEAPTTETEYTLIGRKYAWRCRKLAQDGEVKPKLVWYCPTCWKNLPSEGRR